MKRLEYTVTWGDKSFIKYSWNSVRREIPAILRKELVDGEFFERRDTCYERDERGEHIKGKETWISNLGRKIEFTILRTKDKLGVYLVG